MSNEFVGTASSETLVYSNNNDKTILVNEDIQKSAEMKEVEDIRIPVKQSTEAVKQTGYEEISIVSSDQTEGNTISLKTSETVINSSSTNQNIIADHNCDHSSLWKCDSFYMDLGMLYSNDTFHVSSKKVVDPSSLQVHSSYPILLSLLSDEEDWSQTTYAFSNDWEDRFDQLKQEILSNYINTYFFRFNKNNDE